LRSGTLASASGTGLARLGLAHHDLYAPPCRDTSRNRLSGRQPLRFRSPARLYGVQTSRLRKGPFLRDVLRVTTGAVLVAEWRSIRDFEMAKVSTSVTKAFALLETMARRPRPWGISELARELDLTKSNVH